MFGFGSLVTAGLKGALGGYYNAKGNTPLSQGLGGRQRIGAISGPQPIEEFPQSDEGVGDPLNKKQKFLNTLQAILYGLAGRGDEYVAPYQRQQRFPNATPSLAVPTIGAGMRMPNAGIGQTPQPPALGQIPQRGFGGFDPRNFGG